MASGDDELAGLLGLPPVPPLPHVIAFFTLHLSTLPLLGVLLGTTFWSKRIHRHATSPSFYLAMIVASVFDALLLLGGHPRTLIPPERLRIASAAGAIGAPLLQGGVTLALVLKIWSVVVSVAAPGRPTHLATCFTNTAFLLAFPWLSAAAVTGYTLWYGITHPADIIRAGFYCTVNPNVNPIHSIVVIISIVYLALAIVLSIWSFWLFRRNWAGMIRSKTEVNIDTIFRVLTFSLWVILALGVLSYEYATDTVHPPALIIIATIGPVVFAIFASQRDILRVWGVPGRYVGSGFSPTSDHAHTGTGQTSVKPLSRGKMASFELDDGLSDTRSAKTGQSGAVYTSEGQVFEIVTVQNPGIGDDEVPVDTVAGELGVRSAEGREPLPHARDSGMPFVEY